MRAHATYVQVACVCVCYAYGGIPVSVHPVSVEVTREAPIPWRWLQAVRHVIEVLAPELQASVSSRYS